jgi:phosphatidate cytidylyltransferase
LAVVLSDTGGYAAGVLFGRRKLAPTVSPKKSWEGLAGSFLFSIVGTAVALPLLLPGTWWQGALLGVVVVVTATVGDLAESLLKRDLGIKDMGNLLPEHGGVMDRLDSLLPTAPVVAAFLAVVLA